jgi:murein DD-endopeptidase MepM/ murein hydrolase activator NlpD
MPPSAVARRCRTTEVVLGKAAAGCRRTRGGAAPRRLAAALAVAGLASAAAPALAQEPTGGTAPTLDAPSANEPPAASERAAKLAPPPTANLYGRPAPRVARVACRTACGMAGAARPGSLVRVQGRNLKPIEEVVFLGAADETDDTSVAPRRVRRRTVVARVPRTATSGPIALVRADGTRSPASRRLLTVEPSPVAVPAGTIDAEVQGRKVFYGSRRPAELSYVIGGARPASVQVELVRTDDGTVVEQWAPGVVDSEVPQTIRWNGTVAGKVAPAGLYQFRVTATDAAGVHATSSAVAAPRALEAPGARASRAADVSAEAPGAFRFLRYRFPLVGSHYYGEGAARFGGGRGHQGQDVFADCGTPIVAARGGVVKFKQYQSAAGNYVVIDGARTGVDFGYMHLREAALVDEGDRVKTGQPIGFVGATGRASGCHLHFEEWTAPGWYSGGSPFDPLPELHAWDAQS